MPLPYLIHEDTLLQHVLIHGATGSGKTSLVLCPLVDQLIAHAGRDRDKSVVFIDLKGDRASFYGTWIAAHRAKLPFKWFTTKAGHSSFAMNPFAQKHYSTGLTNNQAAEMLVKSFGLDFGQIYGGSYFRDMALLVLRAILELPEVNSFAKLADYAARHPEFLDLPPKVAEHTTHLSAVLNALAAVAPLNVTSEHEDKAVVANAIDIGDALKTPQVLYFYLPSTLEDVVSFSVAKMVAYLLLTAAAIRPEASRSKTFLVIDEFQRVISPDFALFVQQARAFDIGCILCSQTTADLFSAGTSFADVLAENTATKINLTGIGRMQSQMIREQSPRGLMSLSGVNGQGEATANDMVCDGLGSDEIAEFTARKGEGTIRVSIPHGLTQCGGQQVRFRAVHYITKEEYDLRMKMPWPKTEAHPGTISITNRQQAAVPKPLSQAKKAPLPKPSSQGSLFQKAASQILRDPKSPKSRK